MHAKSQTVTPQHPIRYALAQAERLAGLFCPVTEAQTAAHQQLTKAIRAADLPAAVEAVKAMTRSDLATADWAAWAESWLSKVDRLILTGGA